MGCGVVVYHGERDLSLVVQDDDFTCCGLHDDLMWIKSQMGPWFEIQFRGMVKLEF